MEVCRGKGNRQKDKIQSLDSRSKLHQHEKPIDAEPAGYADRSLYSLFLESLLLFGPRGPAKTVG